MTPIEGAGAERLRLFLINWVSRHPYWMYQGMNAPQIAELLLQEAEFREIWLAGLLQTPDGRVIEQVIASVLPYPASTEFRLMVEAVKLAAGARQKNRQLTAAGWTGLALVCLLLLAASLSD